jgi:hypothetical protein
MREYTIKVMGVGELLDTGIKLFLDRFALFILIGGAWVVSYIPIVALGYGAVFGLQPGGDPVAVQAELTRRFMDPGAMGAFFLCVLLMVSLQYLSTAALTQAISDVYLKQASSWTKCYRAALSRVVPLIWTWLLAGVAISFGFLLLIIPGIVLFFGFFILAPVVMLEQKSGMAALKRTWFLMKNNKLKALAVTVIFVVSQFAIGSIAGLFGTNVIGTPLSLATTVIFFAFGQITATLIYFHARCQKEGFDLEVLSGRQTQG